VPYKKSCMALIAWTRASGGSSSSLTESTGLDTGLLHEDLDALTSIAGDCDSVLEAGAHTGAFESFIENAGSLLRPPLPRLSVHQATLQRIVTCLLGRPKPPCLSELSHLDQTVLINTARSVMRDTSAPHEERVDRLLRELDRSGLSLDDMQLSV
jgi:hypothetical protein